MNVYKKKLNKFVFLYHGNLGTIRTCTGTNTRVGQVEGVQTRLNFLAIVL